MVRQKTSSEYIFFITLLLLFQGITAVMSTRITGLMAILLIVISAFYCYYANSCYKLPKALKLLTVLIVIFTVYGVLLILSGKSLIIKESGDSMPNKKYLVDLLMSLLPIFPFFVFTKRGNITDKSMVKLFFVFLTIAVISYVKARTTGLERALETNQYATDVTNNSGYVILSLLPFIVFFERRPVLRYTLLAFISILVLYSIKRGSILILVFCLMFYLPRALKNAGKATRIITVLVIGAVGYYAYNYITDFIADHSFFATRLELMQEGDLQARSGIWIGIIEAFFDANPFQMLFGRGAWATLEVSSNLAHNDWLEIITNQGLIGVFIFAYFWYTFYRAWRRSKQSYTLFMIMGLLFITHFTRTFFSMSISAMPIYANCLIGYAFARYTELYVPSKSVIERISQTTTAHVSIT